jgi:xanthine dehydrogenase accessory factor
MSRIDEVPMDTASPISTPDSRLGVLERAAELWRTGTPFALATVTVSQRPTSARQGSKAIVSPDGAIFGWVGGACSQPSVIRHAREALADGQARLIRLSPDGDGPREGVIEMAMTCHSGGTLEIFIEPFLPEPYLVVIGDTPVAHALCALGKPLGFQTVALAGESAGADPELAGVSFEELDPTRPSYVVIASMGVVDEEALVAALRFEPTYLAVVGSRRRFAVLAEYARSEGIPDERINAVHAPAGLDIHAETPAEIALSILAQITEVRRTTNAVSEIEPAALSTIGIDPICGMEVDLSTTRWTVEIDGQTIGFCCPACKREYERQTASA